MNQPTDEQIKEAMDRVNREIMVQEKFVEMLYAADSKHPHEQELEYLRTLRTALEQYQKPKTVSRDEKREVQYIHDVPRCFVESCYRTCTDQKRKERLGKMLGIEVEGPSPDDKS